MSPMADQEQHSAQPGSLEERLQALEKRVIGRQRKGHPEQNIISNLIQINNRLASIIAGKDKFNSVSRQIELHHRQIANPALVEQERTDDLLIKREVVLQGECRLRQEHQSLNNICEKQTLLDSNRINDFDQLTPKLNQLRLVAIQQFEQNRKFSEETKKLLGIYNEMMKAVKRQLTHWDARITSIEQEHIESARSSD